MSFSLGRIGYEDGAQGAVVKGDLIEVRIDGHGTRYLVMDAVAYPDGSRCLELLEDPGNAAKHTPS